MGVPGFLISRSFSDSKQVHKHRSVLVTKTKAEKDVALVAILSHKGNEKERSPSLSQTHRGSHLNHLDSFPVINELDN